VNAQLPAPQERAGEYPSGGPHPFYLEVWRAAAPSIDFYSPDIYWPNFEYWIQRYEVPDNAIFVPEARLESAPFNALYAYGQARAIGFSPFAIDTLTLPVKDDEPKPLMMQVYELLDSIRDLLPAAQAAGLLRGLVLHATSPRPTQTVALGGYLFEATLSRSWPARTILADDGAILILQASRDEFYVLGSGLIVSIARDPDIDRGIAGIESVERVSRVAGHWTTETRLNGDQTNQGRQLILDPHREQIYRIRLYAITSERVHEPLTDGRLRASKHSHERSGIVIAKPAPNSMAFPAQHPRLPFCLRPRQNGEGVARPLDELTVHSAP
jgi:hypothetical protein